MERLFMLSATLNPWELIKKRLEVKLSSESYDNWLDKTSLVRSERDMLCVAVPNEETKVWMEEDEYAGYVRSAIRDLELPIRKVIYELPQPQKFNGASARAPEVDSVLREVRFASPASQLNPRFSFESFVVGSCNQFAHAAAKAVASKPSTSYNPLFIYGGVGIGKTHLMHAIGRALLDNYPGMRIVYTSSERFMNEMIASIRLERMPEFHQHYRAADALLVDDIQILSGKQGTQEEFFHTFNELYEHQKQIVISSDSHPKEIPGLVERLRSRFEWGLMVDMQLPDLETKLAILDKKAEAEGVQLPEDVRVFLASKAKSNIRELEGALIKLMAFASLNEVPINLQVAQQCLKHLVHNPERRVTIDSILKAVAERFGLQVSQLKQKSNTKKIVEPRQLAMYLVKELTAASLPEIGRAFGGKHHTTVLHSIQKIETCRHNDVDLNRTIHSLLDSIH
jgi:chromosomal replication initiator protein